MTCGQLVKDVLVCLFWVHTPSLFAIVVNDRQALQTAPAVLWICIHTPYTRMHLQNPETRHVRDRPDIAILPTMHMMMGPAARMEVRILN